MESCVPINEATLVGRYDRMMINKETSVGYVQVLRLAVNARDEKRRLDRKAFR